MRDYTKLTVSEKSHELCLSIYKLVEKFPTFEKYELASQLRRASSSIPINISEGCGYETNKEFSRFLKFSAGSTSEVDYCLRLTKDLGYITEQEFEKHAGEARSIRKMIFKLRKSLR